MALPVHLDRAPHNAHLAAWGRHATGWWACVTFRARVEGDGEPELAVAAWVPAHAVMQANGTTAGTHVDRLVLPDDRARWPAPPRWPAWYAGVWTDGPLPLPPGLTLVTGAAWRKRPPRAAL
ncbi:hypothetical protein [Jatrophihabitans endophyticus]|uniref:hypothetical protein n=1 Tax=Jatrophihabitans endophyticus TaxID=1206085 RepID=UPI0019DDD544|nr:hypothetical protein [Jatrophihabitans endophyticus]MBE7189789.1 hypothetical protein [Jatrophihabitans endophyticus]